MNKSDLKKYAVIAITLLAIMVVGISIAAAQGPSGSDAPAGPQAQEPGSAFIDENGDGQCDLFGTGHAGGQGYRRRGSGAQGVNFVDEDGDGQCDLMGTGAGYGATGENFVDEDGDGICDLAGSGQGGNGNRGGSGNGFGRGMGRGAWGATAAQ